MVTNVVNTLTQLGYPSDLEAEAGRSSTMKKHLPQRRENWLQYIQERQLLRGKLIVFKRRAFKNNALIYKPPKQ